MAAAEAVEPVIAVATTVVEEAAIVVGKEKKKKEKKCLFLELSPGLFIGFVWVAR